MTSYTITVNGRSYDVTVQKKKTAADTSVSTVKTIVPAIAPGNHENPIPASKSNVPSGEGERVLAPMPGKIIEINVRVGERVKKGQALLIMEAMKMHNPVLAANEGIIRDLFVKVNDPVQSGQPLLSIGF